MSNESRITQPLNGVNYIIVGKVVQNICFKEYTNFSSFF